MSEDTALPNGKRKARKSFTRTMKMVRRLHMYTGLLLLPWVIFFGFSGMLFNHPEWLGPVEVLEQVNFEDAGNMSSFQKPDANRIADEVVSLLNDESYGAKFVRVSSDDAVLEGSFSFQCETGKGRAMVIVGPSSGSANVRVFTESGGPEKPAIHGKTIVSNKYSMEGAEDLARALLEKTGLKPVTPLELSERGGAEVRFRLQSMEDDRNWNVVYSMGDGKVSAQDADASSGLDFYSIVGRLHKTHHYPDRVSSRWWWSALADATGLTMVFWGVSGLVMWWQIKPSRVLGICGLSLMAVVAVVVFSGTFSNLTYGPRQSRGGPPSEPRRESPSGERTKLKSGKPNSEPIRSKS